MSPAPPFSPLQPPQPDDPYDDGETSPLPTSERGLPDVADPAFADPLRSSDPSIHTGVDHLGWERLTQSPLAMHERVFLITTIFSNRDGVEVVRHLCGDNAQTFINVVYDASFYILPLPRNRSVNFNSNARVSSIRRWMTSIAHYAGHACAWYARFVAIIPYFQNRWSSHFPVTEPKIHHCVMVGLRMYGRAHLAAWRSPLRC